MVPYLKKQPYCTYMRKVHVVSVIVFLCFIGFDPWDVSQQGLADLLETEAEEQRKPFTARSRSHTTKPKIHSGLTNGVSDHGQTFLSSTGMPNSSLGVSCKGGVSDPWKDELRTLFPDVNISFGGRGKTNRVCFMSTEEAVSVNSLLLRTLQCNINSPLH